TRSLGALTIKGKAEAIAAWEVVAARETRTRLEVAADRGLTPFVGRERELRLLLEAFERARGGHGQVAFLAAEAGVGKSRLLPAMRHRVAGGGRGAAGDRGGGRVAGGALPVVRPSDDLPPAGGPAATAVLDRRGGRRGGGRRE